MTQLFSEFVFSDYHLTTMIGVFCAAQVFT